jgi:YD repeat-containing protein
MMQLTQQGGDTEDLVSHSRIDFTYNADGQFHTISRYDGLTANSTTFIATSTYDYDFAGRLTNLAYAKNTTTYAGYGLSYDADNRLTDFTNSASSSDERQYAYDNAGQLTDVGYAGEAASHDDEAYTYDANGNTLAFNGSTNTVDADNQIASDGTYNYTYDHEGNMIRKEMIHPNVIPGHSVTADYWVYTYDFRNRLTSAVHHNNASDPGEGEDFVDTVEYMYDVFD